MFSAQAASNEIKEASSTPRARTRYLRDAKDSIEAKVFGKELSEKRKQQTEEEAKKTERQEKPIAKGTPQFFDFALTPENSEEQKIFSFFMGFTRQ